MDTDALSERIKNLWRFRSIDALLDWDQETNMPPAGVTLRAEQTALVAGLAHEHLVSDETRRLLDEAAPREDDYVTITNVREVRRLHERAVRLPTELVRDIAHTGSLAKESWAKARAESNFSIFSPLLAKLLELKREVAERIGYEGEPFDALLDEFEPGVKAVAVEAVFEDLRTQTVAFLERIQAASVKPCAGILSRHFPRSGQEVMCRRFAEALNFDLQAGRRDTSVHPFCTTIAPVVDVRVTTRFLEDFLPAALFGTMHEVGHALYEQGFLIDHAFTPMAEPISLGIHESQSRLWENMVGRSKAFWQHHFDGLKAEFPDSLGDVTVDSFYRAINAVEPSLIRVEADELTYNLHIILRFEIERSLFRGDLTVRDIPSAWNEMFQSMLGITPPNDAEGCLQDVHWSMGAFGYFPTYTLGNLYAAQFYQQAERDIPDLKDHIRANNHRPLLDWLRRNIHCHGQRYRARELVERVTGRQLSTEPFMDYVTKKFGEVYEL